MSRLEDDLRASLRRVEPPEGFSRRVMERLRQAENERRETKHRGWLSFPVWRLATAAALCVLVTAGLAYRHQRQLEARREAARQFVIAMRITNSKLEFVRETLRGAAARDVVSLPPAAASLTQSKEKR